MKFELVILGSAAHLKSELVILRSAAHLKFELVILGTAEWAVLEMRTLLACVEWLPLELDSEPASFGAREGCMEGMEVTVEAVFSTSSSAQESDGCK